MAAWDIVYMAGLMATPPPDLQVGKYVLIMPQVFQYGSHGGGGIVGM